MAGLRGKELDFCEVAQQDLDSLKKSNPEIQLVEWEYLYIPFIYWQLDQPPFNDRARPPGGLDGASTATS